MYLEERMIDLFHKESFEDYFTSVSEVEKYFIQIEDEFNVECEACYAGEYQAEDFLVKHYAIVAVQYGNIISIPVSVWINLYENEKN